MKAVLDTVVFVRALINPGSACGRLVFDSLEIYRLIVSPEIMDEYLEVLVRPEIGRKYRSANTRDIATVMSFIARARSVESAPIPGVCRDLEDDKFLAAALAGNAAYIVSEDRDLLDLGEYEGIQILSASAFLKVLGQSAA